MTQTCPGPRIEERGRQDRDVTKVCSVPMPPLHSNPVVGSGVSSGGLGPRLAKHLASSMSLEHMTTKELSQDQQGGTPQPGSPRGYTSKAMSEASSISTRQHEDTIVEQNGLP